MPERYKEVILKHLSQREDQPPLKPRQLARRIGIPDEDYGTFREAVKELRDSGRIVLGSRNALTLPEMGDRITGRFRPNPKGFGFVIPEEPNAHGDLFIPPDNKNGALAGDLVVARSYKRGKRKGQTAYAGEIIKVLQRKQNRYVGMLDKAEDSWFVRPDGKQMTTPIVVRDVTSAGPKQGSKVVVEIVRYPEAGELPEGVIIERLGRQNELEAETLSCIRNHGLNEEFPEEVLQDARRRVETFDPDNPGKREDLTGKTIVTIDPVDARDFDDAISIEKLKDGTVVLGVHIADVAHFVQQGSPLDTEALKRGNSIYFIRKVLPMLPEILSNGVCSLQEGETRFCKSVFIQYDEDAEVIGSRLAETFIRSRKRLTYEDAQNICDGKTGGFDPEVIELVKSMEQLARRIEKRRRKAGMLHLDLPDVELVLDDQEKVCDAVPEDQSYSHTIIEMFMVEANDAVANVLDRHDVPFIRRVHPSPDVEDTTQLGRFTQACGHRLPKSLTRRDLQDLLNAVKGRPESYAVNLAVLKTFQQAVYSPMRVGHFALASTHYCHFTSPIRRYPDLTVHRLVSDFVAGRIDDHKKDDVTQLQELGEHCTATERTAEAAERDLRDVLVLQYLKGKVGENFEGVVTGVANFGIFVQSPRFLVEGLIRLEDLGDDWWEVNAQRGEVVGEVSGRKFRVGDLLAVRIAGVDVAMRQLDLVPVRGAEPKRSKPAKDKSGKTKGRPKGKGKQGKGKASAKARSGGKKNAGKKSRAGKGKARRGKKR